MRVKIYFLLPKTPSNGGWSQFSIAFSCIFQVGQFKPLCFSQFFIHLQKDFAHLLPKDVIILVWNFNLISIIERYKPLKKKLTKMGDTLNVAAALYFQKNFRHAELKAFALYINFNQYVFFTWVSVLFAWFAFIYLY